MTALKMRAIDMIGKLPEEKIAYIIAFMERLQTEESSTVKPRIGAGKGQTVFPADIDFCNDEVAELFYGSEK